MNKHKVDSSNIVSGVFDDSVLPSIFAKIAALTVADKKQTAEEKEVPHVSL